MTMRLTLAGLVALSMAAAAHAQNSAAPAADNAAPPAPPTAAASSGAPTIGTVSTRADAVLTNGRPTECRLSFRVAAPDDSAAEKGGTVYVTGNLAVVGLVGGKPQGSIGIGVTMRDMADEKGQLRLRPATVGAVALIGADGLSNENGRRLSKPGIEAGSIISLFELQGPVLASVLQRIESENQLMLAIRRTPDGPDIHVGIDMTMIAWSPTAPKKGPETIATFTGCINMLMTDMSALVARQRGQ